MKSLYKVIKTLSVICFVCTEHEVKAFLTLKRDPGKLTAVIIKESGREAHPYFTQKELRRTLDKYDIKLMSWYPLGHGDKSLINEPVFAELGKKYG